jgi:hypothetical protein
MTVLASPVPSPLYNPHGFDPPHRPGRRGRGDLGPGLGEEARSPGTARDEGVTRQKWDDETEEETRTLNAYFVAAERLNSKQEFFAQLHARRYRFLAYFGRDAAKPYDDLHKIYAEILVAVRMLIITHRQRDMGFTPQAIPQLKTTIGWGLPENDTIPARLDRIVEAIEKTCQLVIQELGE